MSIHDPIFDGLVQLRMSFTVSRQAELAGRLVRKWFDLAWRELGGPLRDRLAADPPVGPAPGGLYVLANALTPDGAEVAFEYDMARWGGFLGRIEAEPLVGASFHVAGTDAGATMLPYYRTDDYWTVSFHRHAADDAEIIQLAVEGRETYLYRDDAAEAAVASFLGRMAGGPIPTTPRRDSGTRISRPASRRSATCCGSTVWHEPVTPCAATRG